MIFPFVIPEEREVMTNSQVRTLLLEIADYLLAEFTPEPIPHPLDEHVVSRMESNLQASQEARQARSEARWSPGRIPHNLTNPQGIQWPIEKLDDDMRKQILDQDPSLLESEL